MVSLGFGFRDTCWGEVSGGFLGWELEVGVVGRGNLIVKGFWFWV